MESTVLWRQHKRTGTSHAFGVAAKYSLCLKVALTDMREYPEPHKKDCKMCEKRLRRREKRSK